MEAWLCVHSIFKLQSGLGDMTVFNLRWQKNVCGPRSANVVVAASKYLGSSMQQLRMGLPCDVANPAA